MKKLISSNHFFFGLLAAAGALFLFLPSLEFPFFFIDDPFYVEHNPWIRGWSFENIRYLFENNFVKLRVPVTLLSFSLDYSIWGLTPFGYHLSNLLLHLFNILLVYRLLIRFDCSPETAFCATGIFAIHPVQVESVVWITERKNLLSLFFFLLAFNNWMKWLDKSRRINLYLTILLFALSIFSKPLFVLGFSLFIFELLKKENSLNALSLSLLKGPSGFALLSCGMISLLAAFLTLHGHASEHNLSLPFTYTVKERIFTTLTLPWKYFYNLICPDSLSICYMPPTPDTAFDPAILFGVVFTYFIFKNISRRWILWFVVSVLPVSTIIPLPTWMNDRYLYAPLIPLSLMACKGLKVISGKYFSLAGTFVLLMLSFFSFRQIQLWKNSETLLQESMKRAPASIQCREWYLNLSLIQEKPFDKVKSVVEELNILKPNKTYAVYYLYGELLKQGKNQEAHGLLLQALRNNPMDATLNRLCGSLFMEKGDYQKASTFYASIPSWEKQESELALLDQMKILLKRRDYATAREVGQMLPELLPGNPESFNLKAVAELNAGFPEKAMETLIRGTEKFPSDRILRDNLIRLSQSLSIRKTFSFPNPE